MWTSILNILYGFIKQNWRLILIVLLAIALFFSIRSTVNMKEQYLRELGNVNALTTELTLSKTKNNETVATIQELQYTVKEFKKRQAADAKLIKELNIRANEVREVVKTVTETKIVYRDTLMVTHPDSIYNWKKDTRWWSVDQKINTGVNPPVVEFNFESRDSLTHLLYKVPKCKFLGIRWGVKCYEIKVINHNPNSTITYSRWINVSKDGGRRKRE